MEDLIRPQSLRVEEETLSPTYGKFIAEPLERGYGVTLGSALRRVLISSLQGAAITSVRIDGIRSESGRPVGVKEDVTGLLLNLKELRFRLQTKGPKTVRLRAKGPKKVKAKDIVTDEETEILNPEHPIASLSADGSLSMEMVVREGRGYVPAEKSREDHQPTGTLAVDAAFSPVRRADFTVTSARVGQRTDYDRLVLEVRTDGSLTPREAVAQAARILDEQLLAFIPSEKEAPFSLPQSVDQLGLSAHTVNSLKQANIRVAGDLVRMTEEDLTAIKGCGQKCQEEIKETLGDMGLRLGMNSKDWPAERVEKGVEKAAWQKGI